MFSYEALQSYNELETLIYKYIINHKEEVQFMTIRELSESVRVSTSTIIRFCKKQDMKSIQNFECSISFFLKEEKENRKKLSQDSGVDEIMYFLHSVTSAAYEESIVEITKMIQEAVQLIFIEIGTSGILGKYGARYFLNIGKFSQHIEDPYYPIGKDMESTVVIALSESGETQQTLKPAERFKRHNYKIFSITNGSSCTLAKTSDYNLSYFVPKRLVQEEYNITTQVPVIYLLETIGRRLS